MKIGSKPILRRTHAPVLSLYPHRKPILHSRLVTVKRWGGELLYRLANNRYVFYGSLILAASLIVGALSQGHEVLWQSAAALGTAIVIIGLVHACLDVRSAMRRRRSHTKGRVKEW